MEALGLVTNGGSENKPFLSGPAPSPEAGVLRLKENALA